MAETASRLIENWSENLTENWFSNWFCLCGWFLA